MAASSRSMASWYLPGLRFPRASSLRASIWLSTWVMSVVLTRGPGVSRSASLPVPFPDPVLFRAVVPAQIDQRTEFLANVLSFNRADPGVLPTLVQVVELVDAPIDLA